PPRAHLQPVGHLHDVGRGENGGADPDLLQLPGQCGAERTVFGVQVEQHRVMAAWVDDDWPRLAHDPTLSRWSVRPGRGQWRACPGADGCVGGIRPGVTDREERLRRLLANSSTESWPSATSRA